MKRVALIAIAALACAPSSFAKPITRIFQQPCSVVFPAAETLGSASPFKLQLDGKTDMNLIIETGSFWKAGAAQIIVQFSANSDGTCTVTDNSPYSGVRRNGTVFLDRLEKMPAQSNSPQSGPAPPAPAQPGPAQSSPAQPGGAVQPGPTCPESAKPA